MSSVNFNKPLFVLWLMSLTVFNSSIYGLRIFFIVYSVAYPFLYLLSNTSLVVKKEFLWIMGFSLFWTLYFSFWFSININSISFDLSGPNVEMFTPFLYLTNIFSFIMLSRLSNFFLKDSVRNFLKIYCLFLITDCIYRYFVEPNCFLNYSCRYDAKVVGFHSTTNALGVSLIVIISSLLYVNAKSFYKIVLPALLISTMARAAIVAQLVGYGVKTYLNRGFILKFFFIVLSLVLFYYIYLINPFDIFSDGSFLSKIDFFSSALNIIPHSNTRQLLLGYGSNFKEVTEIVGVNGWSPHAPMLKAFFYFGFIGVFLYFASLLSFASLGPGMWFVTMVFFICSIAGAPIYFPTLIPAFLILRYFKAA